ncbi:hypothetical protein LENED_004651 [Lentinula edodes]|uniref:Uncharacterized protein n=1 Tax=Lentinula edodes TaxID=5353 RepID=A0A1Q3E7F1_LENED|nr:hypothetical protein LENED_004651 [Lentinula edodes]
MFMLCQLRFLHELMIGIHPMIIVNLWVTHYDTGLLSGNSESTALFSRPLQRQAFLGKSFPSKIGHVWSIHEYKDHKGKMHKEDMTAVVFTSKTTSGSFQIDVVPVALHNIGANNQNIPVIDEGISIEDGHPRLNRNSVRVNVLGKDTAVILKKIDELVDSGSWNDIPVMIMRGKGGKPLGMTAVYEQANKAQKKSLEEQVKKMTCDKVVSVAKKHQILNRGLEHLDILVTTSGSSVESVTLLTWNVYSIIGKDVPDGELREYLLAEQTNKLLFSKLEFTPDNPQTSITT